MAKKYKGEFNGLNLALGFILEVCALISFTYWGFQNSQGFWKILAIFPQLSW
jgi:predicted negative regulator of RcsB-dependent stress response